VSLKVIKNDAIRSSTHDFLLTFRSNHRPISHRFRDKPRLKLKIANFPTLVYFAPPLTGFPLELGISTGVRKTGKMGLPDGRESSKIGFAVYHHHHHHQFIKTTCQTHVLT